jgi:hemerythrin-like domain-containing protein/quercetin dioxygenase-like cupin family protein
MNLSEPFSTSLLEEHDHTQKTLETLDHLIQAQEDYQTSYTLFKQLALDLKLHFACEENALFPVLNLYRSMILLEVEHDNLLNSMALLEQAFQGSQVELQKAFGAFQDQLLAHIHEENNGIFPFAESVLEPEEKALIHRKFKALQEKLRTNPALAQKLLERPHPHYSSGHIPLGGTLEKPIRYQKLFEADHASMHLIALQSGKSLKQHWAPEHQCFVVLSGSVLFKTLEAEQVFSEGDQIVLEPRLKFSLSAKTDSRLLLMKVWPHPHFIRV